MSKKNRINPSILQRGNNSSAQPPKPSAPQPSALTANDVRNSKSEEEFNRKKNELLEKLAKEVIGYEQDGAKAREDAKAAKERLGEIETEKRNAERDLETVRKKRDEEQSKADKIIADAAAEAEKIHRNAQKTLDDAEREKVNIIKKAADEARGEWKRHADELLAQIKDIAEREQASLRDETQLRRDRRLFEEEKDDLLKDLEEQKDLIARQKEKYFAVSPMKVEELTHDLSEVEQKYDGLLAKHNEQTQKYVELQTALDSIKVELGDSADGGERSTTVRGLIANQKELREKYGSLCSLHERYPDEESIRPLEKAAEQFQALQSKYEKLEQEHDLLRKKDADARIAQKELETIRREYEATQALNDHLLKELESHKTALENRTGDPCPSLRKVDTEVENEEFSEDIKKRQGCERLKSLKEIVSHVKNYAGTGAEGERLYYSDNDIRAFLSGMAVSRLIILQGMSGTGKSSLPRIFSEAISGFNHLNPVESSWRDRNELLGYYNDFNKKFNAKKFTVDLYRSGKNACVEVPAFIVLDEMNLARIEYYFSDFLAILQEPDPDRWLIELVPFDMRPLPESLPDEVKNKMLAEEKNLYAIWEKIQECRDGKRKIPRPDCSNPSECVAYSQLSAGATDDEKTQLSEYLGRLGMLAGAKDLIDGRKIRVAKNIWFIGTANRDDSTFDITDKVYDRAQVVSLNKKGVPDKEGYKSGMRQKYISAAELEGLFEKAKNGADIKSKVENKLKELDELLMDEFDVSFGNRIVEQAINFAAVFVAAGGELENALDYQISTKILRKVIETDKDEALLKLQEKTKDYPETQRLIEKRIRELK